MSCEVDYLQVGNGETSGDCIALRFGDLHSGDPNKQYVVVIDGGFKESGEKLVTLIQSRYGTSYVDLVISTHLDRDHIAGLTPVLEKLTVEKLLMHRPWLHAVDSSKEAFKEAAEARKSYDQAASLEDLATRMGVETLEPFEGGNLQFGATASMTILGPSLNFYEEQLKGYDHNKSALAKLMDSVKSTVITAGEALRKIQETLDPSTETLDHVHKNTSPENNSSVITYFNLDGHHLLFTGDAGVDALHRAADYAVNTGIDLTNLDFFDVPHHGSKHNLDSAFLDRINASTAFISVTQQSEKHPSPRVINALVRRGIRVFTTEASNIWHHHQAPTRSDYGTIEPYGFVEEFDEDA